MNLARNYEKQMEKNGTVTIHATLRIPKQYMELYNAITKLGDIGSLEFIAEGGIIAYMDAVLGELPDVGKAYPEIRSPKVIHRLLAEYS